LAHESAGKIQQRYSKSFSCGGAIYRMMKIFFRSGFESGRRLRIPASGYESRNENVNLTVKDRRQLG
jgi:hypothetical protein